MVIMFFKNVFKRFVYILMCAFLGGIIAVIVWGFLKLMNSGIELIWHWIPSQINIPFYTIIVCLLGGLIIGIFQSKAGPYPEGLETVIAKVKKDNFYPYNKVFIICVAAIIPLIFGGSLGPEAGLTGVIVGLCYWAGSNMKSAKIRKDVLTSIGLSAALGTIFVSPLFGLVVPIEERTDEDKNTVIPKWSKILSIVIAVLSSFGVFMLLTNIFGGGVGMPRIDSAEITNTERIWGIPLALIGVVFGYLYIIFDKTTKNLFGKLQSRVPIIFSTLLGGLMLGIAGTFLPMTMFSGEEQIFELSKSYKEFAPWLLIITGIVKLLITNVCIKSGWHGGHFFPVIFSGISIGYSVAMLTGLDTTFCLAVITAGVLGVIMRRPAAVSLLLLLCFPVRVIPWLIISAFIGSIVPLGRLKSAKNLEENTNAKQ